MLYNISAVSDTDNCRLRTEKDRKRVKEKDKVFLKGEGEKYSSAFSKAEGSFSTNFSLEIISKKLRFSIL